MASEQVPRQVPVAVVGVAAFMPGSTDLEGFWQNVLAGRDLLTDVPSDRWLVEDYYDPEPRAADKTYGKRGAFLPRVGFDPVSYGILPNSLPAIDTSQLLGLMVADRVISDCAVGLPADRGRISVLLGVSSLQLLVEASARLHRPAWLRALREHGIAEVQAQSICDAIAVQFVPWQEETFPGLLTNVVSGRIANKLDLHGTNHTTDAACASSLAALYSAVAELSLLQSDLVITGGVDTMNDVLMYTCFSSTPALSPSGDCRPFSAAADGTMLGEGVAMLALKRLADAERDGDRIYAVIRGIGTSSDGRGTAIYAPLPAGQMRALRRAYEAAGYGPETVELVEAHGTGTAAGDAAEFAALREVFDASGRADRQWCALGSVKSQIGHTKAAAGASGLLKAVLALQHKVLPPTIKVERPNPALGVDDSPFYLNTEPRPWIRPAGECGHPRRASVSSFGFGGTNFHVTVEEYLPASPSAARPAWRVAATPAELIPLSAPTPQELLSRARQLDLRDALRDLARRAQQDFCSRDKARLAIVAQDADDLAAKIAQAAAAIEDGQPLPVQGQVHYSAGHPSPGMVGFLFPGQGSQYVGMGADLAIALPRARAAWDRSAALELGEVPLDRVVYPPPAFTEADRTDQRARLTATEWAQPALAVHSLALLEITSGLGLTPDCVAGHSFGELTALHAAGALDADTLVRLARRRGELMRDASSVPGGMLAVAASRAEAEDAVGDLPEVWLANHNAPQQVVFAGTEPALDALADRLAVRGTSAVRLNAATGFHSPLVAPAAGPLLECLRRADVRAPALTAYAGCDGSVYAADPDAVCSGLAAQIAAPVRFVDVIEAMYASGVRTFVEVGPGATLTSLVGQILGAREHAAISLDRKGRHAVTSLQEGLARLSVRGVPLEFASLSEDFRPIGARQSQDRPRTEVMIDGGNYGRPCPPANAACQVSTASSAPDQPPVAGPAPAPVAAASSRAAAGPVNPAPAAPPALADSGWLHVVEEAQRQAAEAHADFQRTMAESHLTYLRMAEATFAGLLGAATGQIPQLQPPDPVTAPVLPAIPTAGSADMLLPAANIAADPPPVAPAGPADLPPMDADSIGALLLSVVAERTGYPVEMLNVDMELDTDLGIDSIKKVEILSVVRERVGEVPGGDLASLATLRTLRAIAERVGQPGPALAPLPAANSPPAQVSAEGPAGGPAPQIPPAHSARPARWAIRAVASPASGLAMLGLTGGLLAVTEDDAGTAALVAERLGRHGIRAHVVSEVPPDAHGVIVLDGLRRVASVDEALEIQRGVFRAARRIAGRMDTTGGIFVTVQDTGGDFGLRAYAGRGAAGGTDPRRSWLGGIAALTKTVAKEWPKASVKAIDCATDGRSPAEVAEAIVAELLTGAGAITAGIGPDGARISCQLEPSSSASQTGPDIGPDSVIVVTGGARGITAACLRQLAAESGPRLVLLGRTPMDAEPAGLASAAGETALIQLLARQQDADGGASRSPAEIAATARQVLAVREVRETLSAIERAGSPVRYYALDATDKPALDAALAEVRSEWGPISGVVHGAGVLADARVTAKTDEQFTRVFDPKVEGLRALLAATADDPLTLLCAFTSVAAQFGNPGQSDYAMANEAINQVLSAEQARRRGCLVRAIGWGPWLGGMVTTELARRFSAAGVTLIDPKAGAEAFVAELGMATPADVRVILAASTPAALPGAQDALSAQVTVVAPAFGYLADHKLGGVPVVPVATVLDWFAGAALAWRPAASPIVLRDIRVLDKISLPRLADGGHQLVLRGRCDNAADGQAIGLDLRDAAGQPHYRGLAVAAPSPPGAFWWREAPVDLVPVTAPYDGATLFHGQRFQVIRGEPAVSRQGAECTLAGVRVAGWPEASWHVDPAAVDGGLQLAVLWAQRAGAGATLPMAITECRVHRPGAVEREVRCVVRGGHADELTARCDIALIDPDGSPRVELLGVQLVRRPG